MKVNIIIENKQYEIEEGRTILEVLQESGITSVQSPCGGKGVCGKCKVFVKSLSFTGNCLACQTPVADGMEISIKPMSKMTVKESGKCYIWKAEPSSELPERAFGIACDIGTTTVVCHMLDMHTGKRLATIGGANPQGVFGADVISRIQASVEGKRQKLTDAIISLLNSFIKDLCAEAGIKIDEVIYMAVAGNTVMGHLFAGLPPDTIGVAPFTPVSLFGEEYDAAKLGLCFNGKVYIVPAVSGYVGGDITADMLSTRLYQEEQPTLMIDIGTNGEMVLGSRDKMVCCATAAGPAFEGAQIKFGMPAAAGAISEVKIKDSELEIKTIENAKPIGICGSGLIDVLACMLNLGVVDDTGRLLTADEIDGPVSKYLSEDDEGPIFLLSEDKSVYVTQADVRKIQLAKAAIAAGIVVMADDFGVEIKDIAGLILAGGFGSYINPASAARIGLIPPQLLPVTKAVGNAAGEGAVSAVLSHSAREQLNKLYLCNYIELSGLKGFNDAYMEAIMFE
jgi:uncharacterized 2Fe-2S/4Fe-4S cluster protein (DUF4445 family)